MTRRWPVDPAEVVGPGLLVDVFAPDRAPSRDEIVERASGADAIVTSVLDRIDRDLLEALPNLKIVAQAAVGYDNVDVEACRGRGVLVTHTPGVLTESTADLTLALVLAVARRLREGEDLVRANAFSGWSPTMFLGVELAGKTFGVVGYGRIGRAVARRARAFGMRVLACRSDDRPFEDDIAEGTTLARLLAESHVVSLHVPGKASTRHLIGADALARMQRGAILVNTSRGSVVDEAALVRALEAGALGGAGLDVYEHEPRVHPGLLGRRDVVLLPHLGSATREARARMATTALCDAALVLAGKPPRHLVPELASERPRG